MWGQGIAGAEVDGRGRWGEGGRLGEAGEEDVVMAGGGDGPVGCDGAVGGGGVQGEGEGDVAGGVGGRGVCSVSRTLGDGQSLEDSEKGEVVDVLSRAEVKVWEVELRFVMVTSAEDRSVGGGLDAEVELSGGRRRWSVGCEGRPQGETQSGWGRCRRSAVRIPGPGPMSGEGQGALGSGGEDCRGSCCRGCSRWSAKLDVRGGEGAEVAEGDVG